jgi:hypothetical protein
VLSQDELGQVVPAPSHTDEQPLFFASSAHPDEVYPGWQNRSPPPDGQVRQHAPVGPAVVVVVVLVVDVVVVDVVVVVVVPQLISAHVFPG